MKEYSIGFEKFGTKITFSVMGAEGQGERIEETFKKAEDVYKRYDEVFSRFKIDSELSRLNSRIGRWQAASKEVREIVKKSLEYNIETQGYFDTRIAEGLETAGYDRDFSKMAKLQEGEAQALEKNEKTLRDELKIDGEKVFFGRKMDFSGIVKGLVNDKAARLFFEEGLEDFVVNSGGDMFFAGEETEGKKWTVDIDGVPCEKLTLQISNEAIATSGISKRKWVKGGKGRHHLINPKNPNEFRFDLKTVTVIDSLTEKADVWAKTLFLMGREKGIRFSKENGIKSIFLDYSGAVWISQEAIKYKL